MQDLSDDQLVSEYLQGKVEALEILYERYRKPLFGYLCYLLGDRSVAEDVLQECFMRLMQCIERYRPRERFVGFLFTIGNNLVVDYLRKRKRVMVCFSGCAQLSEAKGIDSLLTSKSPEEIVEKEEMNRLLQDAISRLPVEQRQVLLLREYANLSFKEIANLLGCPLNTALGRMHYALKNLRKMLLPCYEVCLPDMGREETLLMVSG